ncbi:MAG: hypothetical protein IJ203_03590 [Atopobiaceae bacterium]|nr:hypothetical protein [Atopobiaceae bacterium]
MHMKSADLTVLYKALYRELAAHGRGEALFGSCGDLALDAFGSAAVGPRMPTVYFEIPLLGEPRFDLQVCVSREDGAVERELPVTALPQLGPLMDWLQRSEDCPGVDLAFDVGAGDVRSPQVMALMTDGVLRDVAGFFAAAGDGQAAKRFVRRARHVPLGWRIWYVGLAPQRAGRPVRLDYSVGPRRQRRYLEDMALFAKDLLSLGYQSSEEQLGWCRQLMELPFGPNLQLDVLEDDSMGPVLGYSLCMPSWGPAKSSESLRQGDLRQACELLQAWGLVDDRWQKLAGCCIGREIVVPVGKGASAFALRCVPTFLKVRMTAQGLLDAKAYLMCDIVALT